MGTNYYAVKNKASISEPIHIGKSSMGWLFLFQDQDNTWGDIPVVWHTYNQVKEWLKKYTTGKKPPYVILDEYDRKVTYNQFIKLVETKQKDKHCLFNPDNFKYNKNIDGYRFSEGDFS
jgi:hypothetical protein